MKPSPAWASKRVSVEIASKLVDARGVNASAVQLLLDIRLLKPRPIG